MGGAWAKMRSSFFVSFDVCRTDRQTVLGFVCLPQGSKTNKAMTIGWNLLDERLGQLLGQLGVTVGRKGDVDKFVELGDEECVKVVIARVKPLIENVDYSELDREHPLLLPLCFAHARIARGCHRHMVPEGGTCHTSRNMWDKWEVPLQQLVKKHDRRSERLIRKKNGLHEFEIWW